MAAASQTMRPEFWRLGTSQSWSGRRYQVACGGARQQWLTGPLADPKGCRPRFAQQRPIFLSNPGLASTPGAVEILLGLLFFSFRDLVPPDLHRKAVGESVCLEV